MTIRVSDLLEMPHLGLSLVTGEEGLGNEVGWAHVCELEDPTPWLEGGEVLMTTGMAVPAAAERQELYIRKLSDRRVSALAISRDMFAPPYTEPMLRAARERALPVLEVSIEVPFLAISRVVAAANQSENERGLLTHVRIFDTLRTTTAQGLGSRELFQRLETISGYRLHLASPAGRPLLEGVPTPPEGVLELPRESGQPPFIPGGLIVSVPLGDRVAGYLVALERADARPAGVPAVQHIATIAALEIANLERQSEVLRREGAETLAELLAGVLDAPTAAKRLALAGFDPSTSLLLLAIRVPEGFDASLLHRAWSGLRLPHLLLMQRELFALVPAVDEALQVLSGYGELGAGASRVFTSADGFGGARREALWSLQRAADRGSGLVRFPEDEEDIAWLPADGLALREASERILGPVLEYDARRGSDLLGSLRVWLEHGRSTQEAAETLSVHKHTLAYRLRRVEELTGRSLASVPDLVDIWLGLRAHEIVHRVGNP